MIEEYFRSLHAILVNLPIVREHTIHFDKRSLTKGYLRGDVTFQDDSHLHFREFVSIGAEIERMVYVYHYQAKDGSMIFRYDNAPHYPDLIHAPHHRHDSMNQVSGIQPPDLEVVLQEIELLLETE